MKKIVLASVLVAGVLFAADFSSSTPEQINAAVAGADAKSLSEAAFEIDKRAGELRAQARDLKRGFKTELKKKLDAMSVEDREKFLDEFRKNYNVQAGKLSVEQADRLDIELKDRGNFGKFKRPAHGFGPHRSQMTPGECGHMPHKGMGDGAGPAMPPRGEMPCNQDAGAAPCPMTQQ